MFSGAILFGGSFRATDSGGDPEGSEQGDATWRIDLSKLAVQTEADLAYFGISFSGDETLVVGAARPVRRAEGPVPRDLRAFVVDAHTGRILGTRVWPNVLASRLALVATQNGNFAVRDGWELAAYSAQLEELKRIPLPEARQKIFEEWKVFATPEGSLIVTAHVIGPKISIQWLQPETLAVQRSWELAEEIPRAKVFPHLSPSSHGVAVSWNGPTGCDVSVQDAPTSWHAVLHDKRPCSGGVQYLNDETLFVSLKGEFQLLSMEGKLLRREVLQNGERALHSVSISAEGGVLPFPFPNSRAGSTSWTSPLTRCWKELRFAIHKPVSLFTPSKGN